MIEKDIEQFFLTTTEQPINSESNFSKEKNLAGEQFTLLALFIISCNLLRFFEENLRGDPEKFVQIVKNLNIFFQNPEYSFRLTSTLLSQGNDLLFTVLPILTTGIVFNSLLVVVNNLPKNITDKFVPSKKIQEEIKTTVVISIGCLFSLAGYYFELTDNSRIPNAVFDYGDILMFSVPFFTTIIYFSRQYNKAVSNKTRNLLIYKNNIE